MFSNVLDNLGTLLNLYQVNDTLLVNELKSRESDLMATNGVIHVIDKLLYPAGEYYLVKFVPTLLNLFACFVTAITLKR